MIPSLYHCIFTFFQTNKMGLVTLFGTKSNILYSRLESYAQQSIYLHLQSKILYLNHFA